MCMKNQSIEGKSSKIKNAKVKNVKHGGYRRGFVPYGIAAFLIGIVGGFSTVLGPAFVQDIGIAYNNTTWTALVQAMSTAACAPIFGKISDVIGHLRMIFSGMVIFAAGNAMSALADSLGFMLAARFIVGVGIAAMTPAILAYILTRFPKEKVAGGFAVYMLISSASVIMGPALGSVIVARFGWRIMIWVCTGICLGALSAALAAAGAAEPGASVSAEAAARSTATEVAGAADARSAGRMGGFDALGAVFVLLFFSIMLSLPVVGQNFGWNTLVLHIVLIAALASLVCLCAAESRAANPLLPKSFIFRKTFVLSVAILFLTQGMMQANMTNLIVFVNYTQPENGTVSGYAISVMYLGMSVGAALLGPLGDKIEPKEVLLGSMVLTGFGCGCLVLFSENTPSWLMMLSLGLLGLGLGGNGTILMKVTLAGLPEREAGAGTGTYGLFRDLAAPFGVAVFVPMYTNRIETLIASGIQPASAAVDAVGNLGLAELLCVGAGVVAVQILPRIHGEKGNFENEIEG